MNTMLQTIQQASGEMGLAIPSAVASSTATDIVQLRYLLNAAGSEIAREYPWQALNSQFIFTVQSTTIEGNTQVGSTEIETTTQPIGIDNTYQISGTGLNQATFVVSTTDVPSLIVSQPATATAAGTTFTLGKVRYSLPSDYDRQIDRTHWDKSKHWEMLGPETAQQWEWLISGYISTGPRIRYRIFGGYFQIWPLVTTGDALGFEYISNAWARDNTGTPKTSFTADNDTCIFSDRLMVLALKKKYFEVKGFDASGFDRDFQRELNISKANDAGSLTLSLAPKVSNILINWTQIPDSGYGS